jgi:subtilisin family serine protease
MSHNPFALIVALICLFFSFNAFSKDDGGTTIDSLDVSYLNWFNADFELNNLMGVSVDKAYAELLKDKQSKKIILVAVIDGGVDVNHEDLLGKIWTNPKEIPDNGIDDDGNGYVDDMHGWNFLGNAEGENIGDENYEFVRIVNQLKTKYDSVDQASIAAADTQEYALYKKCKAEYDQHINETSAQLKGIRGFQDKLAQSAEVLFKYTKTNQPEANQIAAIVTANSEEEGAKKFLIKLFKRGFKFEYLNEALEHFTKDFEINLNMDLNSRQIIGDNLADVNDKFYGNADVKGAQADHGTFVSGIIAANRNNGLGIDGIADNVKIMVLRAVPDGDEYDKDVALSIRYAVDNGAQIINMSFGKDYSPQKQMVDEAIMYAQEHNVLLIHAAGNAGTNNDEIVHYPEKVLNSGEVLQTWITVGANANERSKEMAGRFSNYGKTSVDLFAPGVDVISLAPESKYDIASGTSFSCPVVSGVAALVWSYYPELTALELKEVLLASVNPDKKKVILPNVTTPKKTKVRFNTLSLSGGIVNAYRALQIADEKTNGKK